MKKRLAAFLITGLLLLTACSQADKPDPVAGLSGVTLYNEFISGLHSGEYHRVEYGVQDWYDFISAQSTTVRFSSNELGERELLYRTRNPFVLWHYPTYDYFDGNTYYYKYRDDWFVDLYAPVDRARKNEFIGIRESFFTGNDVVSDLVYPDGDGYRAECVIQSKDKTVYYSMVGDIDAAYQFTKIRIKLYTYNFDEDQYEHITTYRFTYSQINDDFRIEAPEGLQVEEVVNHI